MSMIKANGLLLHVQQLEPADQVRWHDTSESGPEPVATVVLIHGLAVGNLATWYLTLASSFAEAGLRVIMYDLRGHGNSERPATGYRLQDHVDDLEALLVGLGVASPVHLVGVSYGGTIAFDYALRHPDHVAGIATIESIPMTARWASRLAAKLGSDQRSASAVMIEGFRMAPGLRARKAAEEIMTETTLRQDVLASVASSEDEFGYLDLPVLCIYGGDSDLSSFAQYVERMFRRARSVILAGQRHSVLVDSPGAVGELLMSWLRLDCGIMLRATAAEL